MKVIRPSCGPQRREAQLRCWRPPSRHCRTHGCDIGARPEILRKVYPFALMSKQVN